MNSKYSQLEFQDFGADSPTHDNLTSPGTHDSHTLTFDQSPESPVKDVNGKKEESFWSFEYYQQFFNVNTNEVKERIIWGMIPRPGVSYLQNYIKPNPDLYGPFWICITLIFTIAVSGNVANYLQFAAVRSIQWKYDFHLISYAATAIFLYAWLVPLLLWSALKYENNMESSISFLELLCVYGYSLSIYVPVSILWVIQISWFQWLLVLIGATFSGFILITTIAPAVAGSKKILYLGIVIGLHFLLAIGFMLCFFHVPAIQEMKSPTSEIIASIPLNGTQEHKL